MVNAYWADCLLSIPTTSVVIEILLKIGDCMFMKNWPPISLLALTYKIIAKILANLLQSILPKVVDPQQTGFIKGHNIQDNFLA